jgi:PIN like domain
LKFFFDNNLSPYLAHGIRELSKVAPQVENVIHLTDRFARDAKDLTGQWWPQVVACSELVSGGAYRVPWRHSPAAKFQAIAF